jgi:hypothetical protein
MGLLITGEISKVMISMLVWIYWPQAFGYHLALGMRPSENFVSGSVLFSSLRSHDLTLVGSC